MAQSNQMEGLQSALNASMERQKRLHSQQPQKQDLKLVGKNLGRYMTSLTEEVENINREMERGDHTVTECRVFIDRIHELRMALEKTFAQWQRVGGAEEDKRLETGVDKSVVAIQQEAEKLIKNISDTISNVLVSGESRPIVSGVQVTNSKTISNLITPEGSKETGSRTPFKNSGDPTTSKGSKVTKVSKNSISSENPSGIPTTSKDPSAPNSAVENPVASVTETIVKSNESLTSILESTTTSYGSKLAAAGPTKGKRRSKSGSKASSKASSAAKLKLRLEEAEAKVDAEFNVEITQRSQRALARSENKAALERRRRAEEIEAEERRQRGRLELELREQREKMEMEQRRHDEQLKWQREQMEEEVMEREVALRKKEATIKAKQQELERFIEEGSESSVNDESLSLGVTEIAPSEKVKAYVSQPVKVELSLNEPVVERERPGAFAGVLSPELETIPRGEVEHKKDTVSHPFMTNITTEYDNFHASPYNGPLTYTTPIAVPNYTWAPNPLGKKVLAPKSDHVTELLKPILELPIGDEKSKNFKIHDFPKKSKAADVQSVAKLKRAGFDSFPPAIKESSDNRSLNQDHLQSTAVGDISNTDRVIEAMCDQLALTRLPLSEPTVFDGSNPLQFPVWRKSLDSLTSHRALSDTDKLNLLSKYLKGEPLTVIQGYLYLDPSEAFRESYKVLNERYGDNFVVAGTFKERLRAWPQFGATDTVGLRNFLDFLRQCKTAKRRMQTLRCLDDESENIELMKKLPSWLCRQWRRKVSAHREATGEFPSFEEFVDFIAQEDKIAHDPLSRSWEKMEKAKAKRKTTSFLAESNVHKPFPGTGVGRSFGICAFCKGKHSLHGCEAFKDMPYEARERFVINNRLCFSCLNGGHISRNCRNKRTCEVCRGGHPTNMHRPPVQPDEEVLTVPSTVCASSSRSVNTARKSSMVLPVRVSHCNNPERGVTLYVMIDSQSDSSFITDEAAEALGLRGVETHLSLSTMTADGKVVRCNRYRGLEVQGIAGGPKITLPSVFSRRKIPINYNHIPCPEMVEKWPHLTKLRDKIAPRIDAKVGLLLGYDCPRALNPVEVVSAPRSENGPFGMKTELGWGIVGIISPGDDEQDDPIGFSHRIITEQLTGSQIVLRKSVKEVASPSECIKVLERDFMDRTQNNEGSSLEERVFIQTMDEGITVDEENHYSMPLPFNKNKTRLFNNKSLVLNRSMSLKRKFSRDASYRKEYTDFVEDMITRGFAEEVKDPCDGDNVWYIPHFGVYHKTKGKLRVVFDCAAKYEGLSLNDCLLKGPDYLNSLIGILCRFRRFKIAFSCDIEKMFYAFKVHSADRNYLRFLWWKKGDVNQPLSTFRMTAHLFGAVSSPSCASFGLRRVVHEFPDCGSDVTKFITSDFYVDDGLKSVRSEEEAIDLVRRTVEVCRRRGIRLHKFTSNSETLLKSLPESECAEKNNIINLNLDEFPVERVLGILWNIKEDCFQFKVSTNNKPETKRGILSMASSVFDPLGWIAPFSLRAKLVLQAICRDKLDWDEEVLPELLKKWRTWYEETRMLHELKIDRCFQVKVSGEPKEIQWHHFSDASEAAYGACTYLRMIDSLGQVSVKLVMAKSKVAPIAVVTMPRLELMAAVLAARLSGVVNQECDYTGAKHYYWTDSEIVLGYIRNEAKKFKIFVANRIQEIHDISNPSQWRHVSGLENPADLASRGIAAEALIKSTLWYQGPAFLQKSVLVLNNDHPVIGKIDECELKRTISNVVASQEVEEIDDFNRFSSWNSLVRGLARAKQLAILFKKSSSIKNRLRGSSKHQNHEPLSVVDLQAAEMLIVKSTQQSYFKEELDCINSGELISKSSRLFKLSCIVDEHGVLRVGGRLRFTNLYSVYKHPILLPREAHISLLLARECHQAIRHQGRGMTTNEIRARGYWIVGLSTMVKGLINSCVICRAHRGRTVTQRMSDLPFDRAECVPAFTYCGMDVFGPFLVKERRTELKRYGIIFTCLSTRSVHLEMAYSLSTDSFIQTLRKLISIRGPIRHLRCDNGTNFAGANAELMKCAEIIQSPELKNFTLSHNCDISFQMNPPSASHMGGSWERLIGVVRSVLNVILDQHSTRLDDSSLSTFLYEVAAIINSRPLSLEHITDSDHPEPLTPNHLLTGKSRVIVPPPGEFCKNDVYSIKRWRGIQFLADQFWGRWRKEYLQYLQKRSKWQREEREMRVGDVVLLSEPNAPRNDWRRGVVVEVIVSKDGYIRTVKLKVGNTASGSESILTRPVHKLVLLLPSAEK